MKTTGIILIILQIMSYISSIAQERFTWTNSIASFLGYNILGIIGIILLIRHHIKKSKSIENGDSKNEK